VGGDNAHGGEHAARTRTTGQVRHGSMLTIGAAGVVGPLLALIPGSRA
jgi:hypothetical protein